MAAQPDLVPSYVYVDGFNLYYGAVKGTPYKWLNLAEMVRRLLPKNQTLKIEYFTARVRGRPQDPDQPNRQETYLRALNTIPDLETVFGHFRTRAITAPLANPAPGDNPLVRILRTEEKGSDANLASHLLRDGYHGAYAVAIVVSNDSDLVEPICIVREELGKDAIILNPDPKRPSQELKNVASSVKPIRKGVLAASQFPEQMVDEHGPFEKPSRW